MHKLHVSTLDELWDIISVRQCHMDSRTFAVKIFMRHSISSFLKVIGFPFKSYIFHVRFLRDDDLKFISPASFFNAK